MIGASGWSTIRPKLIEVFTECAADQVTSPGGVNLPFETPTWAAEWKDRRVNFINPNQGHALYLKIKSVVGRGWDDIQYLTLDTGLAAGKPETGLFDVFEVTSGYRRFTLQAQSWCLEDTEDVSSMDIIERIRTRLNWERMLQSLLSANVNCDDVMGSRDMTATIDKKRFSITALDVQFTACVIETDPIPTGWFEHVIITSHEQAGSVDVKASLRMIEEELPPL